MTKVGILTLHLHVNYGGILQAAALYRLLEDEGFDPLFLRKDPDNISRTGRLARNLLRVLPGQNFGGVRARARLRAKHEPFIRRFLPNITRPSHDGAELRRAVEQHGVDAVVVGSDQVWRSEYHHDSHYQAYFLDFVPPGVRRLSYAASFGHSNWQHPDKTADIAALLDDFDAVSVRERSGADICRDVLGRGQCEIVLDPTLVVDPLFYQEVAGSFQPPLQPSLVSYVLDEGEGTKIASKAVRAALPASYATIPLSIEEEGQEATIEQWMRAFMSADFVLTDSYHGTIFSILFGKNFITLANVDRGMDRFTTLLSSLGLSDRLVLDPEPSRIASLVRQDIDYAQVNQRLAALRQTSREFLLSALGRGIPVSERGSADLTFAPGRRFPAAALGGQFA